MLMVAEPVRIRQYFCVTVAKQPAVEGQARGKEDFTGLPILPAAQIPYHPTGMTLGWPTEGDTGMWPLKC
jgi:hypothetical protein